MARAFWKGVISFGLVAIPVKMSLATESKTPSFHLLHKKCMTRPKQVLYCPVDNEYFNIKETVRGYEYTRDRFIVMEEKDLAAVPVKSAHSINILSFAKGEEIDPIYYYGSHYIEPEELGAKPFRLLKEALEKTGKVGIAKVSFQHHEHLSCVRPSGDILILHTIHYHDDVLPKEEVNVPKVEFSAEELDMAVSLIETMSKGFNPQQYKDEYQAALKQLIEARIKGEKITAPSVPKMEFADLMAALRTSIEKAKKEPAVLLN